ncbi:MAG: DUF1232 domain-containing protein [Verrucomicrobia bacterium]|nr:DUF1232 domain-containing protein [Verrucomicrobiota bacterium]
MNPLRPALKIREIPALLRSSPAMFRDMLKGRYRKPPVGTMTGAVLGLVYLINPLDLVPDMLPVLGVIDDSLVFGLFLALLSRDVKSYTLWKKNSAPSEPKK